MDDALRSIVYTKYVLNFSTVPAACDIVLVVCVGEFHKMSVPYRNRKADTPYRRIVCVDVLSFHKFSALS